MLAFTSRFLEIRVRRCGLSVYSPTIRTVYGSMHFYKVHIRSSFPFEPDGNPHHELPRWLAATSQVRTTKKLKIKRAKSSLSPSKRIIFLGTVFDLAQMLACITLQHSLLIQSLAASFQCGASHPIRVFQRMLGLMLAASLCFLWTCFTCDPFSIGWKPISHPTLGTWDIFISG